MKLIKNESDKNIKLLKSLSLRKYRKNYMTFFDEGEKNILFSLNSSYEIDKLFISNDAKERFDIENIPSKEKYLVENRIFKKISDTVNSQGIIATYKYKERNIGELNSNFAICLDKIQDPGNMGTIIRTADAFGIKNILLTSGTVDVFSPKVVRSTMGSIYSMNFFNIENIKDIKDKGFKIISTSLNTEKSIDDVKFDEKNVIVFGNESKGVGEEFINNSDELFKIKMKGNAESLNVSVATSIILYEVSKRDIIL